MGKSCGKRRPTIGQVYIYNDDAEMLSSTSGKKEMRLDTPQDRGGVVSMEGDGADEVVPFISRSYEGAKHERHSLMTTILSVYLLHLHVSDKAHSCRQIFLEWL